MSRKAETRDIELKIKHVSGHIFTYTELVWIFTHFAHYKYAICCCQHRWRAVSSETSHAIGMPKPGHKIGYIYIFKTNFRPSFKVIFKKNVIIT